MWDLLTASENTAFTVALLVMLMLAVLEAASLLLGGGLAQVVDRLLPDLDGAPDPGGGAAQGWGLSQLLGWLRQGELPLLMVLVVFLTVFGLLGLGVQALALQLGGSLLPGWLITVPVLLGALPLVRRLSRVLSRILPNDETTAVSADSLIGREAFITLGTASPGMPAEAKVRDQFGHTHYVMVEPSLGETLFVQGTAVLLVERRGGVYRAVRCAHPHLTD
ncbi:MAG: YqiJ family protein [Gammaproteobacteria bacterium]|nr:YqiJ family protein [Gammaproteobacteria bacterium]